jgi:hypothetical protein
VPNQGAVRIAACDGGQCAYGFSKTSVDSFDGIWHHIALVRPRQGPLALYVDCTSVLQTDGLLETLGSDWGVNDGISIGSAIHEGFHPIALSNIRVFQSALTPAQLGGTSCGQSALCYPALNRTDFFTMGVLYDDSGNGNLGFLENRTSISLRNDTSSPHACTGAYI